MSKFIPVRHVHNVRHGWFLLRNRRTLWQMIRDAIRGHYRMSFLTTIVLVLSIAYIVFPFDLLPDAIPVIGWIDDAAVLFIGLKRLVAETHRYIRWKAAERRHGSATRA